MDLKIGVVGLGYVGLPVALAFAEKFPGTVGFDISQRRVEELRAAKDRHSDVPEAELSRTSLLFTGREEDLSGVNFFVVAVPTPIDEDKRPDLGCLRDASVLVGKLIRPGAIIVFESTVYPGVTEEFCGPVIAETSGLQQGKDFLLGYSPERINPGDTEHSLSKITKVVSGENAQALKKIAEVYGCIIEAGIHKASSIKVAEAAKVIENTQRDLNIALMNELSLIFDRLGISSTEVLEAAATKWNFLKFSPGLVGGHCIGVDPYYLTTKAQKLGYQPQVILAGRRINDDMGVFLAQRTVKLMTSGGRPIKDSRVGILGLSFKENVSDTRNSRIPSIVAELREFGVHVMVHDPLALAEDALSEYGIHLSPWKDLMNLDALIYAVPHRVFQQKPLNEFLSKLVKGGAFIDVKSAIDRTQISSEFIYWSL